MGSNGAGHRFQVLGTGPYSLRAEDADSELFSSKIVDLFYFLANGYQGRSFDTEGNHNGCFLSSLLTGYCHQRDIKLHLYSNNGILDHKLHLYSHNGILNEMDKDDVNNLQSNPIGSELEVEMLQDQLEPQTHIGHTFAPLQVWPQFHVILILLASKC